MVWGGSTRGKSEVADVLKIALDRRDKLQRDLEKIDEFIRTAESLIRDAGQSRSSEESEASGSRRTTAPWRSPEAVA